MSNTNLTVDWIGNEALRLAHEKASFIGTINREFDDTYKPGYGSTIRIRIPSQYATRTGRVMDVQDGVQQSTQLAVATQWGVDLRYNSQEMAQDLVNFQKLHLEPAMATLVSKLDGDCLEQATKATYNSVGVPGNTISTLLYPGQARGRLNQYLAPKSNRQLQLDSMSMADLVNTQAIYNNPAAGISEQFREGLVTRTAMADYYENERVYNQSYASGNSSWISSQAITNGTASLLISTTTWFTPTVGSVFTLGFTSSVTSGLRACHPETKQAYSHLQQFVVTAASAATSTVNFSPPIYISGARKNVAQGNGADHDSVLNGISTAIVRFAAGGSSTFAQPLMYYRDAFTFATAPLPLMSDAARCVVKTYDGISLRVWEGSDIRNDEKLTRIDVLWGFATIRAQWACKLIGTPI